MPRITSKKKARAKATKATAARRVRGRLAAESEEDRVLAKLARKTLADDRTEWIPWAEAKKQLGLK